MACSWAVRGLSLPVAALLLSACFFDGGGVGAREAGLDLRRDGPAQERPAPPTDSAPHDLDAGAPSDGGDASPPPDLETPDSLPSFRPPHPISPEGWALRAPLNPGGDPVNAIWATASREIWAVGAKGLVLHGDASGWRPVEVSTTEDLHGVWGSAPDDVWIVGAKGTVLRFDGKTIAAQQPGTAETLRSVHGTGPSDVWVVGDGGVIVRYAAKSWNPWVSGETFDLLGVYATATTAVWAAGKSKKALFFDGSSWATSDTEAYDWRRGVFARSKTDAWLAADRGVSHYDGNGWTKTGSLTVMPTYVHAVHGDASAIWAVGGPKVLRRSSPDWQLVHDFGHPTSLLTVHRGFGVTYAGGSGFLAHDAGGRWARVIEKPSYLLAVAGAGGRVWFGGSSAYIAFEDGRGWQRVAWETTHTFNVRGIWAAASGIAWAVTADGRIARYDAAKGLMVQEHDQLDTLSAIWGASASAIWAVGAKGSLLFSNGAGSWTPQIGAGVHAWRGIWGSGSGDVYVVGGWGQVARFNGTTWAPVAVGPLAPESLRAVHGRSASDVWVVGDKRLVWHFDGTSWSADSRPGMNLDTDLTGVYVAPSGRVWITANGDAAVYHAMPGDASWQTHVIDVGVGGYEVKAIWGAGEEDIWTVGSKGNIRHYRE